MSVLRAVRKRKKVRKLGAIDIIRRAAYADLELDAKVELIRALVPLGLLHVQELLDQEVTVLAGARYARKDESVEGRRHGSNPGTVGLAGQRVPIRVPRLRHIAGSEIPLRSYEAMRGDRDVDDLLLRRVLYGISCRNYEAAAAVIPGAIGLVRGARGFIQASAAQLGVPVGTCPERTWWPCSWTQTFADATMVIALGISWRERSASSASSKRTRRTRPDAVPAVVGRAPRPVVGRLVILVAARGSRPSGRPSGTGPWSTGASGTSARTW